jgi:hypothetical protein
MDNDYIPADFSHDGKHYTGRISPERKQGEISSWHVVLNETFFGYLSHDGSEWQVTEQRPNALVQAIGKYINENRHHLESIHL